MRERDFLALFVFMVALAAVTAWRWEKAEDQAWAPPPPAPADAAYASMDGAPPDLSCDASYYSSPEHGRPTASGELFDSTALTAAVYPGFLKFCPHGSILLVRNVLNKRLVLVRVNDNMPWIYAASGRMLDLSKAAAESLGMVRAGVVPVEVWKLTNGHKDNTQTTKQED